MKTEKQVAEEQIRFWKIAVENDKDNKNYAYQLCKRHKECLEREWNYIIRRLVDIERAIDKYDEGGI